MVLVVVFTATAQIQRGNKQTSSPKTEQTSKNQKSKQSSSTIKQEQKQSAPKSGKTTKKTQRGKATHDVDKYIKLPPKPYNPNTKYMDVLVYFKSNKANISKDQEANVWRISDYLKGHPEATCVIQGYTSTNEGSQEKKTRLAYDRAESIKIMLVCVCGLAANRITAEGCGETNMFDELERNRVSICTIYNNE